MAGLRLVRSMGPLLGWLAGSGRCLWAARRAPVWAAVGVLLVWVVGGCVVSVIWEVGWFVGER